MADAMPSNPYANTQFKPWLFFNVGLDQGFNTISGHDFVRPDLEALQRMLAIGRRDRHIGGIAAAGD